MNDRAVYEFEDGETTFVVAETEEQAWAFYRDEWGGEAPDDEVSCTRVPDDRVLTVGFDDREPGSPASQTQTAAEWARESTVIPSLLASTCW